MTTKAELFSNVARNLGELVIDDYPTAATPTSMDFGALIQKDPMGLIGYRTFLYEGAGATQSRVVASFDPANNRCVYEYAMSPIASVNTKCLIMQSMSGDDLEDSFQRGYHHFYHTRENMRAEWQQWVNSITQLQTQWINEKTSEQSAWVTEYSNQMSNWNGQQVNWELGISGEWRLLLSQINYNKAMAVPSLQIKPVGSMLIGTIALGSLSIPTISLATAPTISSISSYGALVPDEPIFHLAFEKYASSRFVGKGNIDKIYQSAMLGLEQQIQEESKTVSNLKETYTTIWNQHKAEFDQTWASNKERTQQGWMKLTSDYEVHKQNIESRLASLKQSL